MADEFSTRQRAILVKLLHNAQSKTSANSLISEIYRQKEKFPKKSIVLMLQEIAKADKICDGIFKEMQKDFKTDISAAECLQRFLTSYENLKYSRKVSTRQNIETINEDEETLMQRISQRKSATETQANGRNSKENDSRESSDSKISNDSKKNDSKINESKGKNFILAYFLILIALFTNNFPYQRRWISSQRLKWQRSHIKSE